jgi:hypothetical protein
MFRHHLRHHLKQGGAPVAPCVGFDADTASAYLERALDGSTHTQFESHLAGCAACRRQMVGLARLQHEVEALTARPSVAVAEPVWSRWYVTLAQWFDFSGWNRGWAVATACGLLLAVFAATTWRQMTAPQKSAGMVAANIITVAAISTADTAPADVTAAPASAGQEPDGTAGRPAIIQTETLPTPAGLIAFAADKQLERRSAIPPPVTPPDVTLSSNLPAVTRQLEVSSAVPELNNPNFGSQPLPPPPPGASATAVAFGPSRQSLALPIGFGGAQPKRAPSQIWLQPNELEKKELVADLLLPQPTRARDAEAKDKEKPANDPVAAARSRELAKALKGRALSLVPLKDDDSRTKEADKEAKEQLKPMMQRLNGHTFFFEHGYWIDEEYKSDTTMPLVRLTRGNTRYQQTLIENPSLEQFFKLGPVIVVWKGKVYEVGK